jgi:hypothetical protein
VLTPSRSSLARSNHTATVLHGKLYIFGGFTSPNTPATNDLHVLSLPDHASAPSEYQCIPALPATAQDEPPPALVNHEACAIGDSLFFFNGSTPEDRENLRIWEFKTTTLKWRETSLAENAALARRIASGDRSVLPQTEGLLVASSDEATYVLDQTGEHVDTLYYLDEHKEDAVFKTIRFPSVVEAGEKQLLPRARRGAKILPVPTGHGRTYLLLLPGLSPSGDFVPDIWALQLPSTPFSLSSVKDSARDALDDANVPGSQAVLGGDSGQFGWGQVQIEAREVELGSEGKSLPGPLAWYGADVVGQGEVVIWGGVGADDGRSGEGWVLKVR